MSSGGALHQENSPNDKNRCPGNEQRAESVRQVSLHAKSLVAGANCFQGAQGLTPFWLLLSHQRRVKMQKNKIGENRGLELLFYDGTAGAARVGSARQTSQLDQDGATALERDAMPAFPEDARPWKKPPFLATRPYSTQRE